MKIKTIVLLFSLLSVGNFGLVADIISQPYENAGPGVWVNLGDFPNAPTGFLSYKCVVSGHNFVVLSPAQEAQSPGTDLTVFLETEKGFKGVLSVPDWRGANHGYVCQEENGKLSIFTARRTSPPYVQHKPDDVPLLVVDLEELIKTTKESEPAISASFSREKRGQARLMIQNEFVTAPVLLFSWLLGLRPLAGAGGWRRVPVVALGDSFITGYGADIPSETSAKVALSKLRHPELVERSVS